METLSEMFQLEIPTVHSIISKMIINEELMVRLKQIHLFDIPAALHVHKCGYNCLLCRLWQASLDQPTQTVVMHRTEPTSLQNMALQLAEKLGSLVENNERVFDLKQGVYGGYFNRGALCCRLGLEYPSKYTSNSSSERLNSVLDTILISRISLYSRSKRRLSTEAILPERYVEAH